MTPRPALPRIGLVLGSGGARGLAHIVALETFDRLGVVPVQIAGTSIGAVIGAAYAGGASGADLRAHVLHDFRNRTEVMTRLFQTRVGRFADLWKNGLANPVLVDALALLERFLPGQIPPRFEDLRLPLSVIAADFHRLERVVYSQGPLPPAIAASMAIPGLVRPVSFEQRVLIDGGTVDPLPIRAIERPVDRIIAIDVSRAAPREESAKLPGAVETGFRVLDLLQAALAEARFAGLDAPVTRIKAPVEAFNALDFFAAKRILAASAAIIPELEHAILGD